MIRRAWRRSNQHNNHSNRNSYSSNTSRLGASSSIVLVLAVVGFSAWKSTPSHHSFLFRKDNKGNHHDETLANIDASSRDASAAASSRQSPHRFCTRAELAVGHWRPLTIAAPHGRPVAANGATLTAGHPHDNQTQTTRTSTTSTQTSKFDFGSLFYVPAQFKQCPARRTGYVYSADYKSIAALRTYEWVPERSTRNDHKSLDNNNNDNNDDNNIKDNSSCLFLPFDRDTFCQRALGPNQTLLLLGDSLNTEIFHSLLHQLGEYPADYIARAHTRPYDPQHAAARGGRRGNGPQKNRGPENDSHHHPYRYPICHNTATLAYAGLDPLLGKEDATLAHVLQQAQPDVVLMNRGAHVEPLPDIKRALPTFRDTIQHYVTSREQSQHRPRFIWKTTTTGHPNCWEFRQPHDNVTELVQHYIQNQALYNAKLHPLAHSFGWWKFPLETQMLLDYFERDMRMEVMDGYDILLGRPDAHRAKVRKRHDCLHHCQPGPQDVFPRLLQHYLLNTPEHVMMT